MAIALDATANSGGQVAVAAYSYAHVCSTGADRAIFMIAIQDAGSSETVTSITYGGFSATRVAAQLGDGISIDSFYLLNPPTGSNSVAIVFGSAPQTSCVMSMSLTGVNQVRAFNKYASVASTRSSASDAIVSPMAGSFILDAFIDNAISTINVGANQTKVNAVSMSSARAAMSYYTVNPLANASSNLFEWDWGGVSNDTAHAMISAAPTVSNRLGNNIRPAPFSPGLSR